MVDPQTTSRTGTDVATPAIELVGVRQSFGDVDVLQDVGVRFESGSITGLVGPNGAGKSTLLNIAAGAVVPTGGAVFHRGTEITKQRPHARARRGIVRTFQMPAEFGRLSVLENLLVGAAALPGRTFREVFLRRRRSWTDDERAAVGRARELLDRFGLLSKQDDAAGELSGGQRRILDLIRAVMCEPDTLLLDEPFAGVHQSIIREMGTYMLELRDQGVDVVMVAHELDAVDRYCDSVVVLARGSVLFKGTMAEAREHTEVVGAYLAG